jgi:PhnB protein
MPDDQGDRVMHARFKAPGVAFMASDGRPGEEYKGGNISMSIGLDDKKEADRIFNALAEGGTVDMPMQDMFWGAYFGQLTDKYGVDWMINCGNGSTN